MSLKKRASSQQPQANNSNSGMPDLQRRKFTGALATGILAGPAILSLPAYAAEYNLKLANNAPTTYPTNVRARQAVDRIRKATNGQVNIQIFPNNQLGGDPDMFAQVRSGAIDAYMVPGLLAQSAVADSGIHCLAFAFKNYDAVWAGIDGDLGVHIRKSILQAGIHALPRAWDNGFRQVTSRDKPIRTPEDLAGFKIRTPAFPMIVSIFDSLGAAPTAINIKETYAALQTRLADGQENPTLVMEVLKFYEVQKHCSVTNHVWDGFWPGFNAKVWEKLPTQVQKVIEENFTQSGNEQRADIAALEKRTQTELEKKGVTFNQADQSAFRDRLRKVGYYDKWQKSFSTEAWGLLEKYAGKLA
jgi:tripartite ATP-independent transporter DctP family solute receptor